MRLFELKRMRLVMMFAAFFVASGCGVKSSPGVPEDPTYPRVYPYAKGDDQRDNDVQKRTSNRDTEVFPAGGYQPPPPATQLPR